MSILLKIGINLILKFVFSLGFIWITLNYLTDCNDSIISEFYNVKVDISNKNFNQYYFISVEKEHLYFFQVSTAYHLFEKHKVNNSILELNGVAPSYFYLVAEGNNTNDIYQIKYDKNVKGFVLQHLINTNNLVSITLYKAFQICKSLVLFLEFCSILFLLDFSIFNRRKQLLYINLCLSYVISFGFIFLIVFKYFYLTLFDISFVKPGAEYAFLIL